MVEVGLGSNVDECLTSEIELFTRVSHSHCNLPICYVNSMLVLKAEIRF